MMKPYENESDALSIGGSEGLKIENRLDRVSLYGSLDLTKDKAGLLAARQLLAVAQQTVQALEQIKDLPDALPQAPKGRKRDPFA